MRSRRQAVFRQTRRGARSALASAPMLWPDCAGRRPNAAPQRKAARPQCIPGLGNALLDSSPRGRKCLKASVGNSSQRRCFAWPRKSRALAIWANTVGVPVIFSMLTRSRSRALRFTAEPTWVVAATQWRPEHNAGRAFKDTMILERANKCDLSDSKPLRQARVCAPRENLAVHG